MLDEVKWIPCGVGNQFQNNGKSFNNTVPLEMDFGTFINIFEFVRILLTAVIAGVAALVGRVYLPEWADCLIAHNSLFAHTGKLLLLICPYLKCLFAQMAKFESVLRG